ncbi:MAG TPA: hypothetical protein VED63_13320 [Acidimicrobiales bacterium]|nr:hypothetical protein [Acidimicrobiales bacterium]
MVVTPSAIIHLHASTSVLTAVVAAVMAMVGALLADLARAWRAARLSSTAALWNLR